MEKDIIINNSNTHYYEQGSAKDQPIIILHGLRGDHGSLIKFGQMFEDYRVIIPDLPGHGKSDEISSHTMENYSDWLIELIKALNLKQVIVVGHSLGANIGMVAVKKDKGKNIVKLLSFVLYPKYHNSGINRGVKTLYKIGKKIPERISKKLLQSLPISYITLRTMVSSKDKNHIKWIIRDGHRAAQNVSPKVVIDILEDLGTNNMIDYADPSVPQMFVITSEDKFSHNDEIKKISASVKGELVEIDQMGHLAPLEDPQRLMDEIGEWIKSDSSKSRKSA